MRQTAPFPAQVDDFELREALMLLDFYVKRGGLPAQDEAVRGLTAALNDLASRLAPARSAEQVASVLHGYELLDARAVVIPETPIGEAWSRFGGDERALADAALSVAEGHSIPTALQPQGVVVQRVAAEAVRASAYATGAATAQVFFRREQGLVREFAAFLAAAGHAVVAHRYLIPGESLALQSDLFDETVNVLYACAGSVARDSLRLAIGELADCRRLEGTAPAQAILLPRRPAADLLAMLEASAITVVWRDEAGFAQTAGAPLW